LPHQGRYPRVSGQAKILKEAGYEVTVLACARGGGAPDAEVIEGIPVERIRVDTGEMRGPLRQLLPLFLFHVRALRWLRKNSFDMLHCHNLDVLPLGYIAKLVKKARLVFDAHEPDYYALWPKRWRFVVRLIDLLDSFLARRADAVTVTNAFQIRKYARIGVRKVRLVGNYPPPELRVGKEPKRTPTRGEITFGRLGTFYPNVGVEETVEAFGRVIRKQPRARLLLGGRAVNGYREEFLRVLAPFRKQIEYVGAYDARKMPELYSRIDISCLIYPRNDWTRNSTPRKFFDSLANGVPVIMTDIGALGDLIRERKCGLVVDERDVDSICEAMEMMLENPRALEEMSRAAFALAESEYSWQGLVEEYTKLMGEILVL
jgi:glycosyltransferase involved in cell wall biosynthesis